MLSGYKPHLCSTGLNFLRLELNILFGSIPHLSALFQVYVEEWKELKVHIHWGSWFSSAIYMLHGCQHTFLLIK
jgi:hypothetical protein